MTSKATPTTTIAAGGRMLHAVSGYRVQSSEQAGSRRAAVREGSLETLGGARRFLALALHPIPRFTGVISGLVTGLLTSGLWAFLTFVVAPAVRHVHVHTPAGAREVTVSVSRWPMAVAIASVFAVVLCLIAGIRLQLRRDREPVADRA